MILVFGGTTEGKQVAQLLDELDVSYYYSTKTQVAYTGKGTPIHGDMTAKVLESFCVQHSITHIINASHPFAIHLHQTVAALSLTIPILRFQRKFPTRTTHPLVSYVASFEEALVHFKHHNYQSLLALSGVQTIQKLEAYWSQHPTWFRILDRDVSRAIAKAAHFPETYLLFGYPQSKTEEIALFTQLEPEVIFTKESGLNGKLEEKTQAAIALAIPIVILKKPKISNRYICIQSEEELVAYIKTTLC